jgi:hypothetical protein
MTNDDQDDFLDQPLTLTDYVEIIVDDIEQAVDALNAPEIEQLCRAVQKKIGSIIDNRRGSVEPESEPARDRWWIDGGTGDAHVPQLASAGLSGR